MNYCIDIVYVIIRSIKPFEKPHGCQKKPYLGTCVRLEKYFDGAIGESQIMYVGRPQRH